MYNVFFHISFKEKKQIVLLILKVLIMIDF